MVWLAGTTATDQQGRLPDADAAGQMRLVIDNAERALVAAGAGLQHVVSARLYVTDIQRWRDIGEVFRAHFGDVRPALTMVEVSRLIDPRMLIEMDLVAVVDQ
jgi:enamine deaminase RidA (YjgF/YER057c/UK114 family)